METIQVVLERDLLREADRAVKKLKTNRSALFRQALRVYLKRLAVRENELRDRKGYMRYPESRDEPEVWDQVADWPDD